MALRRSGRRRVTTATWSRGRSTSTSGPAPLTATAIGAGSGASAADVSIGPLDGTEPSEGQRGSAGRRLTAITIDQAISSASNVIFTVLAARLLGSDEFGLFSIVFLAYMATQGMARALAGEPLLVRPQESEERPGEAIGSAIVLGLGASVLVGLGAIAAAIWEPDVAPALAIFAVVHPVHHPPGPRAVPRLRHAPAGAARWSSTSGGSASPSSA